MEALIAELFAARTTAHRLHLATSSFAQHIALGELYDSLVGLADSLAEMYQGKYGKLKLADVMPLSETDPLKFINSMATWAEHAKESIDKNDSHLLNEWDNVIAAFYKTKYKLEHLR